MQSILVIPVKKELVTLTGIVVNGAHIGNAITAIKVTVF